jgi:hypothetical protein
MSMWRDLDLEQLDEQANAWSPPRPAEQVEAIVVMTRLDLYNRGRPCGAKALRRRLDEHEHLKPLPSERTIGRILARNGLTYGRTGWYRGDDPRDVPASAERWRPPSHSL